MHRKVKTKVFYPYPPQKVWQFLTDRQALAVWLMKNDFEPRVGHKFQFRTQSLPGIDGAIYCKVLEIDAPKRLAYTWQDSCMCQPSVVTWTLTPVDGGTQLQLEHRELSYEAPKLIEPRSISTRQGLFLDQPTQATQTLAAIATSSMFHSIPLSKCTALDSALFHSMLNGGWDDRLNAKLPQAMVSHD